MTLYKFDCHYYQYGRRTINLCSAAAAAKSLSHSDEWHLLFVSFVFLDCSVIRAIKVIILPRSADSSISTSAHKVIRLSIFSEIFPRDRPWNWKRSIGYVD